MVGIGGQWVDAPKDRAAFITWPHHKPLPPGGGIAGSGARTQWGDWLRLVPIPRPPCSVGVGQAGWGAWTALRTRGVIVEPSLVIVERGSCGC